MEDSRADKARKMKLRRFIAFLILMTMVLSPFLDSMACDDFARSSPSPGSAFTICCRDFFADPRSSAGSGQNSDGQPLPENHVHVLCPICLAVADGLSAYDPDVFEVAIFKPISFSVFLIQPSIPIYKPPQNQSSGFPAVFA